MGLTQMHGRLLYMTQCERVLAYIKDHGSITQQEAIIFCGHCYRLSARIGDINSKKLGWTEHHIINENPMGKFGRYRFETDEEMEARLNG